LLTLCSITVAVVTVSVCGCGSAAVSTASGSASPRVASPAPVDLTPPTTIYAGDSTTVGAELSPPSTVAKVSAKRALRASRIDPQGRLTGTVLADVTLPGASYHGGPFKDVTSWVYVYTFPQSFDPRSSGAIRSSPARSPMLVQQGVFIVDAANGKFVGGFFTK
jgi:hypothetical protein